MYSEIIAKCIIKKYENNDCELDKVLYNNNIENDKIDKMNMMIANITDFEKQIIQKNIMFNNQELQKQKIDLDKKYKDEYENNFNLLIQKEKMVIQNQHIIELNDIQQQLNKVIFEKSNLEILLKNENEKIQKIKEDMDEEIKSIKNKNNELKNDNQKEIENVKKNYEQIINKLIESKNVEIDRIQKTYDKMFQNQKEEIESYKIKTEKDREEYLENNRELYKQIYKNINVQETGKIGEYNNLEILQKTFSTNLDINFSNVSGKSETGDIFVELYKYTGIIDIKNHQKNSIDQKIRGNIMDKIKRDIKIQNVDFGILATTSTQGFCNGKRDLEIEWVENKLLLYISGLEIDNEKICRVILLIKDILDIKNLNSNDKNTNFLTLLRNLYKNLEENNKLITNCIDYNNKQEKELIKIQNNIKKDIDELIKNNISTPNIKMNNTKKSTKKEIQKLLEKNKIPYDKKAPKEELLKLLKDDFQN